MTAPLLPERLALKSTEPLTSAELAHADRVARTKALDAELSNMSRSVGYSPAGTRSSSGIQQILLEPDVPCKSVAKSSPVDLHPKVKAISNRLTANAAGLLSLVAKADDAYGGAQLIDLSSLTMKSALGIPEKDAVAARSELVGAGLIVFRDNGSGYHGYRPRLP